MNANSENKCKENNTATLKQNGSDLKGIYVNKIERKTIQQEKYEWCWIKKTEFLETKTNSFPTNKMLEIVRERSIPTFNRNLSKISFKAPFK